MSELRWVQPTGIGPRHQDKAASLELPRALLVRVAQDPEERGEDALRGGVGARGEGRLRLADREGLAGRQVRRGPRVAQPTFTRSA